VEAIQRKGLRVSVVSTVRSQPPMIADELRRQVDNFIELEDLRASIARAPGSRDLQDDAVPQNDDTAPDLQDDFDDHDEMEIA